MELEKIVLTEKEAALYICMSMSFLRNARIYGVKPLFSHLNTYTIPKFLILYFARPKDYKYQSNCFDDH
ncbi:MAG: hypothetical protein K0S29_1155 [Gammaproteobacteria bacterium]|jgi:hypothetical protein|nr:hypothetical protein [Gammaproteobacteria bacterium]